MQKKFIFLPQTTEVYKFLAPKCLERAAALLFQVKFRKESHSKALHCIYLQNNFIGENVVRAFRHTVTKVWVQFSSVSQSCPTLCNPMNCSTPGLPVHHQLPEFTQTHVHWVGNAIQPSHPLSSPSPPALNLFQHQGLFQWVSSLHQVAKVLEFQLQHQSFQWTSRTDLF